MQIAGVVALQTHTQYNTQDICTQRLHSQQRSCPVIQTRTATHFNQYAVMQPSPATPTGDHPAKRRLTSPGDAEAAAILASCIQHVPPTLTASSAPPAAAISKQQKGYAAMNSGKNTMGQLFLPLPLPLETASTPNTPHTAQHTTDSPPNRHASRIDHAAIAPQRSAAVRQAMALEATCLSRALQCLYDAYSTPADNSSTGSQSHRKSVTAGRTVKPKLPSKRKQTQPPAAAAEPAPDSAWRVELDECTYHLHIYHGSQHINTVYHIAADQAGTLEQPLFVVNIADCQPPSYDDLNAWTSADSTALWDGVLMDNLRLLNVTQHAGSTPPVVHSESAWQPGPPSEVKWNHPTNSHTGCVFSHASLSGAPQAVQDRMRAAMPPAAWYRLLDEACRSPSLAVLQQQMQQSWSNAAMHRRIFPVAGSCIDDYQLYKKHTLAVTGFHTELGAASAVNLMLPCDQDNQVDGVCTWYGMNGAHAKPALIRKWRSLNEAYPTMMRQRMDQLQQQYSAHPATANLDWLEDGLPAAEVELRQHRWWQAVGYSRATANGSNQIAYWTTLAYLIEAQVPLWYVTQTAMQLVVSPSNELSPMHMVVFHGNGEPRGKVKDNRWVYQLAINWYTHPRALNAQLELYSPHMASADTYNSAYNTANAIPVYKLRHYSEGTTEVMRKRLYNGSTRPKHLEEAKRMVPFFDLLPSLADSLAERVATVRRYYPDSQITDKVQMCMAPECRDPQCLHDEQGNTCPHLTDYPSVWVAEEKLYCYRHAIEHGEQVRKLAHR